MVKVIILVSSIVFLIILAVILVSIERHFRIKMYEEAKPLIDELEALEKEIEEMKTQIEQAEKEKQEYMDEQRKLHTIEVDYEKLNQAVATRFRKEIESVAS